MKRNIAVLYGGYSSEYDISVKSSKQVINWLDKNKYNVFPVLVCKEGFFYPDKNGKSLNLNNFSIEENHNIIRFDFAYIIIHGAPGENGLLPGYLEMLGIPHSTCPSLVSALTFNKYFCKQAIQPLPVNMAKSLLLRKNESYDIKQIIKHLGLPVFVKPNNGGSSCGTSKVKSIDEFEHALSAAFNEDNEVIIEEFIQGIEISCGVVKTKTFSAVLPITEIVPKKEFFDYEAKYTPGMSEEITPARIPHHVYETCQSYTSQIYDFLGCKGVVRIDYIVRNQQLYFLEINTIPGMSEASIIPQQARYYGISMTELLSHIIEDHF
ncbi:MAG: D-alanine--D-alanine ligase [Bacteroidales bacterium]|nr:D-alanine--D-alanine ligase [Bacteroidales bacterium]